jgi:FdhD protein
MAKGSSKVEIVAVSRKGTKEKADVVIQEEVVVVRTGGEVHKFHCLPANLEEMILGNLKSRGMDVSFSAIRKIAPGEFEVALLPSAKSPGKCLSHKKITPEEVFAAVGLLDENSPLFQKTGGAHVIGICGDKKVFVEDTSRHCAIDKAIGRAIREGIDLSRSFLVVSCRQTATTIKKAIWVRIPIVISLSAPTSLAVKEARQHEITLIGFATQEKFNVYSHPWRVKT